MSPTATARVTGASGSRATVESVETGTERDRA